MTLAFRSTSVSVDREALIAHATHAALDAAANALAVKHSEAAA